MKIAAANFRLLPANAVSPCEFQVRDGKRRFPLRILVCRGETKIAAANFHLPPANAVLPGEFPIRKGKRDFPLRILACRMEMKTAAANFCFLSATAISQAEFSQFCEWFFALLRKIVSHHGSRSR